MRIYKKSSASNSVKLRDGNSLIFSNESINYEQLYESVKSYLAFRISVTTEIKERLVYLELMDYMERIQLEAKKVR